jgi:lipooligosaccharide transport system permease protein
MPNNSTDSTTASTSASTPAAESQRNAALPGAARVGENFLAAPIDTASAQPRNFVGRVMSVWYRHVRVYSRTLISNALPPFLEPLIFLVGIGMGLGQFVGTMDGQPYIQYLAAGLLITAAMFTATFECSFGTYIRLEFDKVYDGMLGAPITANNLLLGEIVWAATKGFVFTLAVLIVAMTAGILSPGWILFAPIIGFFTGAMFATLGLLMNAFVKNINQFNFLFSGLISPMFFFAGVVFPIENLPRAAQPIAMILPLTHPVRLTRALAGAGWSPELWWSILYIAVVTAAMGTAALKLLNRKLVD